MAGPLRVAGVGEGGGDARGAQQRECTGGVALSVRLTCAFESGTESPCLSRLFLQFMTAGQVSVSLTYRCAESFQHGSYNLVYSWIQRTERAKW